jgi:hypothetical protein
MNWTEQPTVYEYPDQTRIGEGGPAWLGPPEYPWPPSPLPERLGPRPAVRVIDGGNLRVRPPDDRPTAGSTVLEVFDVIECGDRVPLIRLHPGLETGELLRWRRWEAKTVDVDWGPGRTERWRPSLRRVRKRLLESPWRLALGASLAAPAWMDALAGAPERTEVFIALDYETYLNLAWAPPKTQDFVLDLKGTA